MAGPCRYLPRLIVASADVVEHLGAYGRSFLSQQQPPNGMPDPSQGIVGIGGGSRPSLTPPPPSSPPSHHSAAAIHSRIHGLWAGLVGPLAKAKLLPHKNDRHDIGADRQLIG